MMRGAKTLPICGIKAGTAIAALPNMIGDHDIVRQRLHAAQAIVINGLAAATGARDNEVAPSPVARREIERIGALWLQASRSSGRAPECAANGRRPAACRFSSGRHQT